MTEETKDDKPEARENSEDFKNSGNSGNLDNSENSELPDDMPVITDVDPSQSYIASQQVAQEDVSEQQVDLEKKIAILEAALAQQTEKTLRIQAESENFKRRLQQDKQTSLKFAVEGFVKNLIPILDSFDQAVIFAQDKNQSAKKIASGFNLIHTQFLELLEKESIKPIHSTGAFDPHYHQAISQVNSDEIPENHIVETMQTGYLYHDRVIRPAMVSVSTGNNKKEN